MRSRAGFNLVEMSIALVVVAIGMMSVAAIFPDQLDSVRKTTDRAQHGQFAQSVESVLRSIAVAGGDIGNLPASILPAGHIVLPPVGGGKWTSAQNGDLIKLDVVTTALTSVDPPIPDPKKGDGMKFIDISNPNYITQSLWYHIHVQPLPSTAGHRVVIYTWRSDGEVANPPVETALTPAPTSYADVKDRTKIAEVYVTEIYKF